MSNLAEPADRFADQVLPYQPQLRSAALRLSGNPADAEDLVQETFAKAFAGFATFQQGTNLRAWLHRIQANAFYGTCRARRRRPQEFPLDAIEPSTSERTAVARRGAVFAPDDVSREGVRRARQRGAARVELQYGDPCGVRGEAGAVIIDRLQCGQGAVGVNPQRWQLATIFRLHASRATPQAHRAPVVTETEPHADNVGGSCTRKRPHSRKAREKLFVFRNDPIDLRLLEHDFGNENRVRIASTSPRQVSRLLGVPLQQCLVYTCRVRHR